MGDLLLGIIDDNCKLVGEKFVGTQQHEIADLDGKILRNAALYGILKTDGAFAYPHAPGAGFLAVRQSISASSWIDRCAVTGQHRIFDLLARTGATEDVIVVEEQIQCRLIGSTSRAL